MVGAQQTLVLSPPLLPVSGVKDVCHERTRNRTVRKRQASILNSVSSQPAGSPGAVGAVLGADHSVVQPGRHTVANRTKHTVGCKVDDAEEEERSRESKCQAFAGRQAG